MTLSAEQVALGIRGVPLLNEVTLKVLPGQITAVLGPNGAGKTSLLRVLTGDIAPSRGVVMLDDKALPAYTSQERARRIAVLPQHSVLDFPFSVEEVVLLGRTPHDTGLARDIEIVHETLEAVDAVYLKQRNYTHLSGGERQRVHLARVLAQIWEPEENASRYLVLDEPTASFDLAHQEMTMALVDRLANEQVAVIMVLHDLNLAAKCAHTMVMLQCGRLLTQGTPDQVLTRETVRAVFEVDASIGRHPRTNTPLVLT